MSSVNCLARAALAVSISLACTTEPGESRILTRGNGSAGSSAAGSGGAPPVSISGGGPSIMTPDGGTELGGTGGALLPGQIPPDFTKADIGGWKLGEPVTDTGASGSGGGGGSGGEATSCGTKILAVVRDFEDTHPDFEDRIATVQGIVEPVLGADQKPIYAADGETAATRSQADFDQWYRNVPDVNQPFTIEFFLVPNAGVLTFESNEFFPLDGAGFGNQSRDHNFHFTTEIHTAFRYNGGETFRFIGDDDLWVFINGVLAIDLGGVHAADDDEVDLDAEAATFGITVGGVYPLDLFHAERHTSESNFRIDTSLEFVDCGTVVF